MAKNEKQIYDLQELFFLQESAGVHVMLVAALVYINSTAARRKLMIFKCGLKTTRLVEKNQ